MHHVAEWSSAEGAPVRPTASPRRRSPRSAHASPRDLEREVVKQALLVLLKKKPIKPAALAVFAAATVVR